ncbi:MAG: hypothetical protein EXQ74_02015 [Thermoleophilia bacterium]|nr:hypothetical protein [Thermoleophilia bacterium]
MRSRSQMMVARGATAALVVVALAGCGGGAAQSTVSKGTVTGIPTTSPLAGLQDDRAWQVAPKQIEARVEKMIRMGARIIRVDVRWDVVAPTRPARPKDQNDPAYRWDAFDAIVDAAAPRGVRVLMTVWGTPDWAADPAVAKTARYPDYARQPLTAVEYGNFAYALASRYTPRGVRDWEAWNEPNIPIFLRPQFRKQGGRWVPASPATYTALARTFYANIKAIDTGARIAGLVTAPAGDQCPSSCPRSADSRMTPSAFLAEVAKPGLRPPMTAVSHHPYPITTPRDTNFAESSYIDLYNLDRFQAEVDRTYLRGKKIWLTEFGFSTVKVIDYALNVSEVEQAQYLQDAYRRVRSNTRIGMFVWYFLQDNGAWGSGLLTQSGTAKPAAEVFSIPMAPVSTTPIRSGGTATLVGQVRTTRQTTQVTVQRKVGASWVEQAVVSTGKDGSFALNVRPAFSTLYRAIWTGDVPSGPRQTRSSWPVMVRVT